MLETLVNKIVAIKAKLTWWRWPILIAVIAVAFFVAWWVIRRQRRAIADLGHARFAATVALRDVATAASVNTDLAAARELIARVEDAKRTLEAIEAQIKLIRSQYNETLDRTSHLTWNDLPAGDGPR